MGCEKSKITSPQKEVAKEVGIVTCNKMCSYRSGSIALPEHFKVIAAKKEHSRLEARRFTDYQVDIIHSTWPLLSSDITATGSSVFLDIFANEPEVKKLFPFMMDKLPEQIGTDPRFLDHATKFMSALSCICDMLPNLDPQAPIGQSLMLLGARHATIPGFSVTYFSIFQKCLHLTWERFLHEEYTTDVREAWNIIFEFGMERIRDGYLLYNEEQSKNPDNLVASEDNDKNCMMSIASHPMTSSTL